MIPIHHSRKSYTDQTVKVVAESEVETSVVLALFLSRFMKISNLINRFQNFKNHIKSNEWWFYLWFSFISTKTNQKYKSEFILWQISTVEIIYIFPVTKFKNMLWIYWLCQKNLINSDHHTLLLMWFLKVWNLLMRFENLMNLNKNNTKTTLVSTSDSATTFTVLSV